MNIDLRNGNCKDVLKTLLDNSIDAIVTDPPYEIGFMGKAWDSTGIAYDKEMWGECLRVLKPGGHLLSFSATRTYHRMACAIEDAGFEVRDMIEWVYGSGFPKSLNIGKAIDKKHGAVGSYNVTDDDMELSKNFSEKLTQRKFIRKDRSKSNPIIYNPENEQAKNFKGWGTALKPAHEPICMARKPISEKTVAQNCLKWGTGGINIDESRVEANEFSKDLGTERVSSEDYIFQLNKNGGTRLSGGGASSNLGRFPANLIHDGSEEVVACFPETKGAGNKHTEIKQHGRGIFGGGRMSADYVYDAGGNASRFFKSIIYQAKASKSERGATNNHPTVKPIALMSYLIKMVTKENDIVLDPFLGSGTTGIAAKQNNRNFVGIEMDEHNFEICQNRINSILI